MHILLIEDELKTREYLYKGLSEQAFTVEMASNGEEGLYLASEKRFDLIILDIMLPKLDGFSLIKKIRHINAEQRIIFLTARDHLEDKVKGLQLGADDYLVKPFSFSELLARIHAILRRGIIYNNYYTKIADLEIDMFKHKVLRKTGAIHLSPKEYALLLLLAKHSGQILSRTIIAEKVWDINFDCDSNVVDVAIKRLRQKVDGQSSKKLIHTARGIGYVLEER
jgi:two-component system, OmpR family, copper resistance phosphate regulon response regulator CusR